MRPALVLSGIVLCAAAAVGAARCLRSETDPAEVRAAPAADPGERTIRGCVAGLFGDPAFLEVRCTPVSFSPEDACRGAALDSEGCFEVHGLLDTDYRLELVMRADPLEVLARREFVRPGAEPLDLAVDPLWRARSETH